MLTLAYWLSKTTAASTPSPYYFVAETFARIVGDHELAATRAFHTRLLILCNDNFDFNIDRVTCFRNFSGNTFQIGSATRTGYGFEYNNLIRCVRQF
jgi:hypothetical protein